MDFCAQFPQFFPPLRSFSRLKNLSEAFSLSLALSDGNKLSLDLLFSLFHIISQSPRDGKERRLYHDHILHREGSSIHSGDAVLACLCVKWIGFNASACGSVCVILSVWRASLTLAANLTPSHTALPR